MFQSLTKNGDWHIHLLLKSDKTLYIKNSVLNEIWQNGFVVVKRLKDIDNIGAYVSAYLIDIKEGETTKKGARLYLYPANHKLYRASRGIKKPVSEEITYTEAMQKIKGQYKTFENTIKIDDGKGFSSYIHYEYYNEKRKEEN